MINNIINNINIDSLPDDVQNAMFEEFTKLPVKDRLIVLSRLTHGNLFKAEQVDIFRVNKGSVTKTYDNYINNVKHLMLDE
jgi:hypothetical protein